MNALFNYITYNKLNFIQLSGVSLIISVKGTTRQRCPPRTNGTSNAIDRYYKLWYYKNRTFIFYKQKNNKENQKRKQKLTN